MAQQAQQALEIEAIEWHIRLRNGGDRDDWEAFMRWLDADPARSSAYDAIKFADAAIEPAMIPMAPLPVTANDDDPHSRYGAGLWASGLAAVAAILLLALVAWPRLTAGPDLYEIATGAGRHRTVTMGDGSHVALNGSTRLVLDRNNPRYAELPAGEAVFQVRHDAARPFTVVAGDQRVQDVGTTFNLVRDRGLLSVEVIDGAVLFDPDGAAVPLAAGQTLEMREGGGDAVLGRRDRRDMAGWRRGRLSYTSVPLDRVARDLSRSLGIMVTLDPHIAALPFTGSILLDRDPAVSLSRVASTLGLRARRSGGHWLIAPPAPAPR
jgi:transmembrane sensor